MEDYSNFKGAVPSTSLSERIWGVQKKGKAADRNPQNGKKHLRGSKGNRREDSLREGEDMVDIPVQGSEQEEIGYGSRKIKRKAQRQIDLVI